MRPVFPVLLVFAFTFAAEDKPYVPDFTPQPPVKALTPEEELKTIETSILTQDTRRHSLPGKIRLGRNFTLYLREIYSILA